YFPARHWGTVAGDRRRRMVGQYHFPPYLREGLQATAQILNGEDGAVIGEIPCQHRVAPDHKRGSLAGLLDDTSPGNAAVLADEGTRSQQGNASAAEWQHDLGAKGVARRPAELQLVGGNGFADLLDQRALVGRQRNWLSLGPARADDEG